MTFKEIPIGEYVLRFWPSDNGWMCGITPEMMEALEQTQRTWVGLTDEEIADAVRDLSFPSITAIARAIETKIRRHWVGLTEDERTAIREAVQQYHKVEDWNYAKAVQFATELKLQEKNS